MNRDKLIIIGANEYQKTLVEDAKLLGYETHVFAWEEGAEAKEIADYFYPISITEKEQILRIAKKINPVGVISIASDLAVPTVNYIANRLGLVGNSDYSGKVSTNKYEMRKVFEQKKLPSPRFKIVDAHYNLQNLEIEFPLIVKPVDRSGSRGVSKVECFSELKTAIKEALEVSFCKKVLLEEFVEGKEYSLEMISYRGEHYFIALTEKFTTGSPHFIETMHFQPADVDEDIKQEIIKVIKVALDALDIKFGASHSEIKIDENGNFKIIEIGARMGGDFIGSDLVKISTGINFNKLVIDISTGKSPDFNLKNKKTKFALVKFIFDNNDLKVLEAIKKYHPDILYKVGKIRNITDKSIRDSSERFGYFIIACDKKEDCFNYIRL